MVVSEMGEQWSPHTAPAMQAETHMTPMGSVMGNTSSVMGISMPKVPQLVPVAKLRKQPMRNTMAGRKDWKLWAELFTGRSYVCASPEGIGHCLEGPGAGQYQYCWDHGLEALGQHAHHLLAAQGLLHGR